MNAGMNNSRNGRPLPLEVASSIFSIIKLFAESNPLNRHVYGPPTTWSFEAYVLNGILINYSALQSTIATLFLALRCLSLPWMIYQRQNLGPAHILKPVVDVVILAFAMSTASYFQLFLGVAGIVVSSLAMIQLACPVSDFGLIDVIIGIVLQVVNSLRSDSASKLGALWILFVVLLLYRNWSYPTVTNGLMKERTQCLPSWWNCSNRNGTDQLSLPV